MSTMVTLSDSGGFFNSFVQAFTAGTLLSFIVDATTHFAGGTPDSFAFSLLDSTGLPIPTLDSLGTDTFVSIDLGPSPLIQTFGTDPDRATIALGAPQATAVVPEPGTLVLLGSGLAGLAAAHRRRKKQLGS